MTIHYASPSADSPQIALKGLDDMARHAPDPRFADLRAAQAGDLQLAVPHTTHHVRLDDLAVRRLPGTPAITGWRYLAMAGSVALASAEVAAGTDGRPTGLDQVNMGPFVQSTSETLAELAETTEVRAGDYELRMLKIPALSAFVLWLYPLDGNAESTNLFVPLAPAPTFLSPGRLYREDELLDALHGPARDRLRFDDSRNEPHHSE
jgi:hypothetical protein